MVSWFDDLGFGLGSSLGRVGGSMAFTVHISNLKGSKREEESPDSKKKEVEVTQVTLLLENEILKTVCSAIDQKYGTSEIQIKQQTAANQHQLQQGNLEFKFLKRRQK